ncbi:MAG TPA: VC0807 family protein [Pseudonocardiaceae bacterium]
MAEPTARQKARYLLLMLGNAAIDLLLPTVMLVVLAPTGMPAAERLAIGGTLLSGKAVAGRVETRTFRWRLALVAGLVPSAAIAACYLASVGTVPSMVAGAVVSAVIVIGDLLRPANRTRFDAFAVLVLLEVVTGVVLTSITGDPRFGLARVSLYLAIGGVFILATTFSQRPLMRTALKPVAAKGDPARADAFDRTWRKSRQFRLLYRAMTAGLGVALLADAVLRVIVIYSQPASAVTESSLTSQIPLVVLIAVWFAAGRGLAVPRAARLLDAELASTELTAAAAGVKDLAHVRDGGR